MNAHDRKDQAEKEPPAQAEAAAAPQPTAEELEADALKGKFLNGINWFYWIGGLSLVNIGMGFIERKFLFGLGVSELLEAFALNGDEISYPLMAASVLISLAFIGLGWMGRKGKQAFILGGLVFYALDAAILAMASDWISVAFHAFAGWSIYKGWEALKAIRKGALAAAAAAG